MLEVQKKLFELSDPKYAEFQAKLAPTIPAASCIGVRVPDLRKFASDFAKSHDYEAFLESLPHEYYDENLLHSILLERGKDFHRTLEQVERFLPFVDNWAVCDTLRPKVFAKHKTEVLPFIKKWLACSEIYTCRFGLDMLMTHFLDEDFSVDFLELAASVKSDEYYVKMMVAWFFATALAKQWDSTVPYLEKHLLSDWVHHKTVQKACESFRITPDQKTYLRTL